ncbi:MAG: glutaredoxin family protein [Acidimicrobiales bacterium]
MSETDPARPPDVVFYWRRGCPFCWMLRRSLHRAGVPMEERNIWDDPGAAAFVRSVAGGNETVPTVVVDGKALVNPSASAVLARLGPRPCIQAGSPRRCWLRRVVRRRARS